jgi:hypothetical protein
LSHTPTSRQVLPGNRPMTGSAGMRARLS